MPSRVDDGDRPLAPPAACAAGIVFALPIEAAAFERLAVDRRELHAGGLVFHEGTVAGARVAWCVGGMGAAAAARAARLLIDGHRPPLLITAGFAGGLDAALRRGAVVRPVVAAADNSTERIPLTLEPPPASPPPSTLTIVSVEDIAGTVAAKRALAERTGAQLVDMETHAVAAVARAAGLPCAGIRVISDDASQELPREVATLARPQSAMRRIGAVIGVFGRRPGVAIDLWRLYEHAVVDGKTLAAAIEDLCRSLAMRSA
jgi:adenosylhomocysteine nucleosidase